MKGMLCSFGQELQLLQPFKTGQCRTRELKISLSTHCRLRYRQQFNTEHILVQLNPLVIKMELIVLTISSNMGSAPDQTCLMYIASLNVVNVGVSLLGCIGSVHAQ